MLQNVAGQNVYFYIFNLNGAPQSGLAATMQVTVCIDGGAQAFGAGTVVDDGQGQYHYQPTQAETNGLSVAFAFLPIPGGPPPFPILPTSREFFTIPYTDVWAVNVPGPYVAGQAGYELGQVPAGGLTLGTIIESTYTLQDVLKIVAAVLSGTSTMVGPVAIFRSLDGTKNRATFTLAAGGQRISVTFDLT